MNVWRKEGTSEKNVPMLLLLAVGIIEFLYITLERQFSNIGYYLAETYVIVPCLLFLGYMLGKKLEPFARRRLMLSVAAKPLSARRAITLFISVCVPVT